MNDLFSCTGCNNYPCTRCAVILKQGENMDRDEIMEEVQDFLDYGEDEDDFTIMDNGDSLTIIVNC